MRRSLARVSLLGLSALALGGCTLVTPSPSGFHDYVALGDSLSAGMQSRALTREHQRAAFPVVLSHLAGQPIHAPETLYPGCPPPQGALPLPTACVRANPFAQARNLAVPGANVRDVQHTSAFNAPGFSSFLYGLVLGTDTQVTAASRLRPAFMTLWVGSNDVFRPTLRGQPEKATPPEEFAEDYGALLEALAPIDARVIVITVPDVTRAPAFIPGPRLHELGLAGEDCARSVNVVSHVVLRSSRYSKPVSCEAWYALTPEEADVARQTVRAYNGSVRALAEEHGHAVFDADELFDDFTSVPYDPVSAQPFGPLFSGDGIHPSDDGQARIARALASFVNARFGTRVRVD